MLTRDKENVPIECPHQWNPASAQEINVLLSCWYGSP